MDVRPAARAAGDAARRDALITRHLPLVRTIARTMARRVAGSAVVEFDDLIGYGVEGLIQAVDSYDPSYDVPFTAWARLHIRTTLQDALRTLDPVPHAIRARGREIQQAAAALAARHGAWPTTREIAAEVGIPLHKLRGLLRVLTRRSVSLERVVESPHDNGPGASLLDTIVHDDPAGQPGVALDLEETYRLVRDAVARLPERERTILGRYYRDGLDMAGIARELGVTQGRISQLHARALRALHAALAGG